MIDIFETRMIKKPHSAWRIRGFKYVTSEGFLLLRKISDSLKAISQENNKRYSFFSSDNLRGHSDQEWVSILNSKENWEKYKNNKSKKEMRDIDVLNQEWDRQKSFALRSNESLVKSFDTVQFGLKHLQKAMKEFKKSSWQLPKEFRHQYGKYLKNLNAELEDTKNLFSFRPAVQNNGA